MTHLVVRRLLVDLESSVARHWCGGDAFRTAFFNALSMSFPVGEQFFIDSVRAGLQTLSPQQQAQFSFELQGFIGQEATHRRLHALFNAQIAKHGLVNEWEPRARARLATLNTFHPRHWLAVTAATEHFTAVFANWVLRNPDWFEGAEERLKTLWMWHCAEESEHKATAFDLYLALGGTAKSRIKWFKRLTIVFLSDLRRQTINNLRRDGTLWQWRTWASAYEFLFGPRGLIRQSYPAWRAYKNTDFHPNQLSHELAQDWLQSNVHTYALVGVGAHPLQVNTP